jgi:transcription initiation factor TFIID subunit TAF12
VDNYHADLDRALHAKVKATEMITEIYVQRPRLAAFMEAARVTLRHRRANMIYGTVGLIEKDDETMLAWAREIQGLANAGRVNAKGLPNLLQLAVPLGSVGRLAGYKTAYPEYGVITPQGLSVPCPSVQGPTCVSARGVAAGPPLREGR